jgi:predicted nucleic-acid-binding protein
MIIDANIILRSILNDNEQLAKQARIIIENSECFAPNEVIAEVVFVLQKVYEVPRQEIATLISNSFKYFEVADEILLKESLLFYAKTNLYFVDCILAAYSSVKNEDVATFDKKLNNFIFRLEK